MILYCFSIPTDVVAEIVSPDIPRNCRGNFATLLQQKKVRKLSVPTPELISKLFSTKLCRCRPNL